ISTAWRVVQKSNPALANPYFSPEFTAAVAAVRNDVEVAVLVGATGAVGFLPYERGLRDVGTPVGGILSDYHGLISSPSLKFEPLDLLKSCRLAAWDFDHLLASQECFRPFHHHREPSPQIDVSRGYTAYAAERRA